MPSITSPVFSTRPELQLIAPYWIHVPGRWRASSHGVHCAGLAESEQLIDSVGRSQGTWLTAVLRNG
jgi:hypothetical protein